MAWSAGSRWVGVGPDGGTGGGGGDGPATPWVLAPGGGVNTGTIYETLQALSAAADTVQPDGLIDVWLDATANGDVYTATTDNGLVNIQRIRLTGSNGHGFIRPTIVVPTGVSFESPGEIIGAAISGTGGRLVIPDGGRLLADVATISITTGSQAVIQQLSGIGATFFKGVVVGSSVAEPCIQAASGAMLVGQWLGCTVREGAVSNSAGAGTAEIEMVSTGVDEPQTYMIGEFNYQPGGISATNPQGYPLYPGNILGFVPSSTTVGVTGTIGAGSARDQMNEVNIVKSSTTSFNLATIGPGGRDYISPLANGLHSFYAIYGPNLPVSVIISQDHVNPALSGGYTHYVFIGRGTVSGGATISIRTMVGDGRQVSELANLVTSIAANTETATSLATLLEASTGRTKAIVSRLDNLASTGFVSLRLAAGGTNINYTINGVGSAATLKVPITSTTIYLYSSLAGTNGLSTIQSWDLTRGAK